MDGLGLVPRYSLLRRMPRDASSTLTWAAALLFACAMFATWHTMVKAVYWPWHTSPESVSHLAGRDRVLIVLALAAPVGLCRRWPVYVLGVVTAEYLLGSLFGLRPTAMPLGLAALVFAICATRPRPVGLVASIATLVAWGVQEWMVGEDPLTAKNYVDAVLVLAVAFVAGVLVRERSEHGRALREQVAAQAVTAERLRIARELHDMVAHSIGIVAIQAGAARRVIDTQPDRAREALGAIETTSRETLAGLRHMLGALRRAESDRDASAPMPGLADLDRLAAHAADAGVRVDLRRTGDRRQLPQEIELSAYRIVQESVTNVVRHSGARHCQVDVEYGQRELIIEITDDGHRGAGVPSGPPAHADAAAAAAQGRAPELDGYGLAGMRERVSLLHGRFDAGPRPGGGFRVAARIPG